MISTALAASTEISKAPTTHLGVWDLVTQSGIVAQLVLLSLVLASVVCWAVIIGKSKALKRAKSENSEFLNLFWHGKNLEEIFQSSDRFRDSPVASVFKSGIRELKKVTSNDARTLDEYGLTNIERALARTANTEISVLEKQVGMLATTASAAPFIGLFGTVWGIMNSFQSIGLSGAANLAVVAPGISEALVTTAAGIAAAVPAVIAYNHFGLQIRRMAVDMDIFTQDFLNILQRSVIQQKKTSSEAHHS